LENCEPPCDDTWIRQGFSAFKQSADIGRDREEVQVELGDLEGRWNIIGLFYDSFTAEQLTRDLELGDPKLPACLIPDGQNLNMILNSKLTDTNREFGFFSVPIEYRKYGIRFETEISLGCGFFARINSGVSNICQEPVFNDLSCESTGLTCSVHDCCDVTDCATNTCDFISPLAESTSSCANANCCIDWANCACKRFVIDQIMKQRDKLAESLKYDIQPFNKTAFEDIEFTINWAHMYTVNRDSCDWPYFIFTPFWAVGATFPTGSKTDRCDERFFNFLFHKEIDDSRKMLLYKAFALPSGNNGHWSYGGRFGCTFDFAEFFAVGAEAGFTAFSKRNYINFPVPTADDRAVAELQSGIFPSLETVTIHPGFNWNFAATLSAYHFLGRWSTWVQYEVMGHNQDEIKFFVCDDDVDTTVFGEVRREQGERNVEKLERLSDFRLHVVNAALNYDIAQCFTLGLVWQVPVAQKNAYQASTWMLTVELYY